MEFIEYPKALYRQGEYTAVNDYEAEEAHRAEGWTDWHSDQARMAAPEAPAPVAPPAAPPPVATEAPKNKGGRPRKVQ